MAPAPKKSASPLLNDVGVMAQQEWLGSEPELVPIFSALESLRKKAIGWEEVMKLNQDHLIKEYGATLDPDSMKPKDRPRFNALVNAAKEYHKILVQYQKSALDLVNKASPILIERIAKAYGVSAKPFLDALKTEFDQNQAMFDTIADVMHVMRWPASEKPLPEEMIEDFRHSTTILTSRDLSISDLFHEPKALENYQKVLNVKEVARDHIMIRLMGAIVSNMTLIVDAARANVTAITPDTAPGQRR